MWKSYHWVSIYTTRTVRYIHRSGLGRNEWPLNSIVWFTKNTTVKNKTVASIDVWIQIYLTNFYADTPKHSLVSLVLLEINVKLNEQMSETSEREENQSMRVGKMTFSSQLNSRKISIQLKIIKLLCENTGNLSCMETWLFAVEEVFSAVVFFQPPKFFGFHVNEFSSMPTLFAWTYLCHLPS